MYNSSTQPAVRRASVTAPSEAAAGRRAGQLTQLEADLAVADSRSVAGAKRQLGATLTQKQHAADAEMRQLIAAEVVRYVGPFIALKPEWSL